VIDFHSARNIVGIVYCNRKGHAPDRAVWMTMNIYNGNTIVFSKTPSNNPFTDGLVQYINLRRSEACQPYYDSCPNHMQQLSDGSCLGVQAPIDFTSPNF